MLFSTPKLLVLGSHWVLPQLDRRSLTDAFQRLLISDTTGVVKPDTVAFRELIGGEIAPAEILFIDDQEHNVRAAGRLGLETLQASPGGEWVDAVGRVLQYRRKSPAYCQRITALTKV